jgi:hypothetical protein
VINQQTQQKKHLKHHHKSQQRKAHRQRNALHVLHHAKKPFVMTTFGWNVIRKALSLPLTGEDVSVTLLQPLFQDCGIEEEEPDTLQVLYTVLMEERRIV